MDYLLEAILESDDDYETMFQVNPLGAFVAMNDARVVARMVEEEKIAVEWTHWKIAAEQHYWQILQFLMEHTDATNAALWFLRLLEVGDESLLDFLVEFTAPDDDELGRWFTYAMAVQNLAIARALIERYRLNPVADLVRAIRQAPWDLDFLLAAGANPDQVDPRTGNYLLQLTVENNQVETARMLMNAGANPNRTDSRTGRTLLQLALDSNSLDLAQALLAYGAWPVGHPNLQSEQFVIPSITRYGPRPKGGRKSKP